MWSRYLRALVTYSRTLAVASASRVFDDSKDSFWLGVSLSSAGETRSFCKVDRKEQEQARLVSYSRLKCC